jgi:hypothetical protein
MVSVLARHAAGLRPCGVCSPAVSAGVVGENEAALVFVDFADASLVAGSGSRLKE